MLTNLTKKNWVDSGTVTLTPWSTMTVIPQNGRNFQILWQLADGMPHEHLGLRVGGVEGVTGGGAGEGAPPV